MAENIFANLKSYGANSWKVVKSRKLSPEEKAMVVEATVARNEKSDFSDNISICCVMIDGNRKYIPASKEHISKQIGERVNVDDIEIVTLKQDGDDKLITRANC